MNTVEHGAVCDCGHQVYQTSKCMPYLAKPRVVKFQQMPAGFLSWTQTLHAGCTETVQLLYLSGTPASGRANSKPFTPQNTGSRGVEGVRSMCNCCARDQVFGA